jgi:hypothetical protein
MKRKSLPSIAAGLFAIWIGFACGAQASDQKLASAAMKAPEMETPPSPLEEAMPPFPQVPAFASKLSPSAQEVANDLGIFPSASQLLDAESRGGKNDVQVVAVRQQLLMKVLIASFEIRSAVSRIDDEISRANEFRDIMSDKRERKVEDSSVVNFMTGGTSGIVNNALTDFGTGKQGGGLLYSGGVVGLVGGAAQIGISTISLKLNKGAHKSAPPQPNMLAPIFGYRGPETNFPPGVWEFLSDPYPGAASETETRQRHLIKQWIRLGRLKPLTTKEGQHQVGLLTGMIAQRKEVTIDLLEDRVLMLSDLRAAVSEMDVEMLEITRWVQTL